MPASNLFTTDSESTLGSIMKPKTDSQPLPQPKQNVIEEKILKAYKKRETQAVKKQIQNVKSSKSEPIPVKTTSKTDKEKLILKILKYQSNKRFGERIKKDLSIKYTRTQLLKCSNENLESILFRIRNYLNTTNMDAVFEHMARYAAKGYEDLLSQFYDIEGFSDMLMQNPAFWDAFERWKIEKEMPNIPPSMQMFYIIASTTYITHLQNQMKTLKRIPQQQVKSATKSNSKQSEKNDTGENKKKQKLSVGDIL